MRRSRRRLAVGLLVLLLLAGGVAGGVVWAGSDTGPEIVETAAEVAGTPEEDGEPVGLDTSVFAPEASAPGADADGRRAAVLIGHGFGGSKEDVAAEAREVAAEGYVVMTWTARGFGSSGGLIHLASPDYEIADVSLLVDELAERDDVRLDGDGDPVVGIAGASYGGAAALLGAAYDDRIDAAVPAMTWHSLEQALLPRGVFKQRWAALLYGAGLTPGGSPAAVGAGDPRQALCGRFAADVCALYDRLASGGTARTAGSRLLAASSLTQTALDGYRAPTLLVQGSQDSLFGLDQAQQTATDLAQEGVEVALRWAEGGHDAAGLAGADDVVAQALPWFDAHLRGGPDVATSDVEVSLPPPVLRQADVEERVVARDALLDPPTTEVALTGGDQPVLSPAGGQPSALTTLPGSGAAAGAAAAALGQSYALAALPGATAVFETAEFPEATTVAGAPEVTLELGSTADDATLFASLWVVGEDGTASLPRGLVTPVSVSGLGSQGRRVAVALPTAAYRVEAGQRLRLVVASTDQAYLLPTDARAYTVGLAETTLVLPTPPTRAATDGAPLVPVALLAGVGSLLGLAVLGALVAALLGRRRRRRGRARAEDAETPLVVEGLTKEYSNGFRAVDGVSWRAERGQVVGLLGPNGAGKTTTMRMLVGLIGADAGTVRVMGERVGPGSPVLGRVGALIEGPGFLPHLSGRDNLRAYWAATGRPAAEAGLEDALEVAALGVAADKPVRSYSQGMRQRLGIAQAMLGRPELLLLDEPTNGLDPPQIRAMRDVVTSYAATGRTVVVSSHLLGEVEQTCSHVVVMHRGRVVLAGAVADLVEATGTTVVTLSGDDDATRAAELLRRLPGVEAVEVQADGRLRVDGDVPRSRVVAALVRARYGVESVDGRRQLEEVFMGLVGEGQPAQVAPAEPAANRAGRRS